MVKTFRPTRTNKNLVKKTPVVQTTNKRAGEMAPSINKHRFKTHTQELAQISLNLVDKIEHLAPQEKQRSVHENSFTFDEIQKITTFEKNKMWSRAIEGTLVFLKDLIYFITCVQ
jgi:sialic acid synthase SpsE